MTKQRLEGVLSKSLKLNKNLFGYKLHNNPLAHQITYSDFIVHNKNGKTIYIECKECRLVDNKGAFSFDRLSQEESLIILDSFSGFIECFVMILFREKRLKDSFCFLIPFKEYKSFKSFIGKKSANISDFKDNFSKYILLPEKGSIYKLHILENI